MVFEATVSLFSERQNLYRDPKGPEIETLVEDYKGNEGQQPTFALVCNPVGASICYIITP